MIVTPHLYVVIGEVVVARLVGGYCRGPVLGAVALALPVPGAGAALLAAAVPQPLACNQTKPLSIVYRRCYNLLWEIVSSIIAQVSL